MFDIQFGASNGQTQNFNSRLSNDTSESAMEIAGMKVFKSIRTIRIEIFEILPKTSHVELFWY